MKTVLWPKVASQDEKTIKSVCVQKLTITFSDEGKTFAGRRKNVRDYIVNVLEIIFHRVVNGHLKDQSVI